MQVQDEGGGCTGVQGVQGCLGGIKVLEGEKGEVKPPKCPTPTRQSGLADTYYICMYICICKSSCSESVEARLEAPGRIHALFGFSEHSPGPKPHGAQPADGRGANSRSHGPAEVWHGSAVDMSHGQYHCHLLRNSFHLCKI